MRKIVMLGALAALLVPTASHAQFQVGLRAGFAPAIGDYAKDLKMKDMTMKSQIPIQLEAAYKATKDIAVGAYFSYGFGQTDDAMFAALMGGQNVCTMDGVDCSGSSLRFGVQGIYTFNQVKAPLVPWAGLGLGWEIAKTKLEADGGDMEISASGFELALQAGGDYRVNDKFAVGPYVMLSIGQYGSAEIKENGDTIADGSIDSKSMHEWLSFGVRGTFDF